MDLNWRMAESVGPRGLTLLPSLQAFRLAGPTLVESQMKLERFRGQSHPRKHLLHHLTVGTSRRSQKRDPLTAPTETLSAPFHRRLPTFPQVEAMFPDQTQGQRGKCRAGGGASSQRNANPAASPLHRRLYVSLWGFGLYWEPDAESWEPGVKGVRGTESGDTGQSLAPAAGQVEGTSALGAALLLQSYKVFLDSRNSTWNLRAGTDRKLSKTSL